MQFNLLSIRQDHLDRRISDFIFQMNPSIRAARSEGLRLASTLGFSILQGLIRRHCTRLRASGGLDGAPIQNPNWRDKDERCIDDQNRLHKPNYFDELKIWENYQASEEVSATLREIDNLERYDIDNLSNKMIGIDQVDDHDKGFLFVIKNQRNANIHGQFDSRVIGSVVLILCCLLIWDFVDVSTFEETRKTSFSY